MVPDRPINSKIIQLMSEDSKERKKERKPSQPEPFE
jgi:hypothetical protein